MASNTCHLSGPPGGSGGWAGVGFTNHTLMLSADEYIITPKRWFQPASQDVVLAGTSIVKPMVIASARAAHVGAMIFEFL
jgi:hypothetical protein